MVLSANVSSTWFSLPTSSHAAGKLGRTTRCTWSATTTSRFSSWGEGGRGEGGREGEREGERDGGSKGDREAGSE